MVAEPDRLMMSVEDYLTLDRTSVEVRYEYIDGYVYMLAGGTADHSTISINLTSLLHSLLRSSPCRVYNSDVKVQLTETRYVYPDVSVGCDERDRLNDDVSRWWALEPGENTLRYFPESFDVGSEAVITYRSAWL